MYGSIVRTVAVCLVLATTARADFKWSSRDLLCIPEGDAGFTLDGGNTLDIFVPFIWDGPGGMIDLPTTSEDADRGEAAWFRPRDGVFAGPGFDGVALDPGDDSYAFYELVFEDPADSWGALGMAVPAGRTYDDLLPFRIDPATPDPTRRMADPVSGYSLVFEPVPEPASLVLFGLGSVLLVLRLRRRGS